MLVAKASAPARSSRSPRCSSAPTDYFGLVERVRARGVDIPILPGIMPILNLSAIRRQGELIGTACPTRSSPGSPRTTATRPRVRAEGIKLAAELCEELLDGGAPGLHFYTLNRSKATLRDLRGASNHGLTELASAGPIACGHQRGGQPDERHAGAGRGVRAGGVHPGDRGARAEPVADRAAALPQHAQRRAAPLLDQVPRATGRPG